jgi:hypothetical protein
VRNGCFCFALHVYNLCLIQILFESGSEQGVFEQAARAMRVAWTAARVSKTRFWGTKKRLGVFVGFVEFVLFFVRFATGVVLEIWRSLWRLLKQCREAKRKELPETQRKKNSSLCVFFSFL